MSSIKGTCVGFLNKGWETVSKFPSSIKGWTVYTAVVGATSAIASNLLYQRKCETPEPKCTTTPASGHLWWHVPERTECDTPKEACVESYVPYSLIVPAVALVPHAVRLAAYSIGKMRSCYGVDQRLARIVFEVDVTVRGVCRNKALRENLKLNGPQLEAKMFEFYLKDFYKIQKDPWRVILAAHPEKKNMDKSELLQKLEVYYSDEEKAKRRKTANRCHEVFYRNSSRPELKRDCIAKALASDPSLTGEGLEKKALEIYLRDKFSDCSGILEHYLLKGKEALVNVVKDIKRDISVEDLDLLVDSFCQKQGIELLSPGLSLDENTGLARIEGSSGLNKNEKKDIADRLLKAFYKADQKNNLRLADPKQACQASALLHCKGPPGDVLDDCAAGFYIQDIYANAKENVDMYLFEAKFNIFRVNPELAGQCKDNLNQLLQEFCKTHGIDVPASSPVSADSDSEDEKA